MRAPMRRKALRFGISVWSAIWKWCPGTASWKLVLARLK